MTLEITSKNIDGITDLVVVAPIKEGFIAAYENVTYATRLRIVAEALNRIRISAREYEPRAPFSDVTQRILMLLDFRVGVIDKDLFALPPWKSKSKVLESKAAGQDGTAPPIQSRRYLYLAATFDGAWEPYMRRIWKPLGPFLDLLFCNCEGYVTAGDHSFEEYAQWVRDNQIDSAIFFAASGATVRDQLYLGRLEYLQRSLPAAQSDLEIARLKMMDPDVAATMERMKAVEAMRKYAAHDPHGDPSAYLKIHELALEGLTVLYRLADFYPPEWLVQQGELNEGRYLARVAHELLRGWDRLIPEHDPVWDATIGHMFKEPLNWYRTGKDHVDALKARRRVTDDPELVRSEVQGGMLAPQGDRNNPMLHGALMLMTVREKGAAATRAFLQKLLAEKRIHFEEGDGAVPEDGFFRTIGFTADGLRRLGLDTCIIDFFPKEFREGMEARSGLLGDMRENHPRNWKLPRRGGPLLPGEAPSAAEPPPVELSEVDFVIQVRTARDDREGLIAEIRKLASEAGSAGGATMQSCQMMLSYYHGGDGPGISRDHFGFRDGISQPKPMERAGGIDERPFGVMRMGELLLGYRNDRGDDAPASFSSLFADWRKERRGDALHYQLNGSFMAIRKLEQHPEDFETFIAGEVERLRAEQPDLAGKIDAAWLKGKIVGRSPDGPPPIASRDDTLNNFDYDKDSTGEQCPFASHIRRANPRNLVQDCPAPRLVRRGMSFDDSESGGGKGLVFIAYNASLAEQFETIQRWINGGNSTDIASGHNDPLLGVAPRTGAAEPAQQVFRFVERVSPEGAQPEDVRVFRVTMPEKRLVSLHWGLYLFVPSRYALARLCTLEEDYRALDDSLENRGREIIERMNSIADKATRGHEWKRLLEDFDAKDPAQKNMSPDVWAALRWYYGGVKRIEGGSSPSPDLPDEGPMVLVASEHLALEVLGDWKTYSTEEQLRRIRDNSGPIFVTQQPRNNYKSPALLAQNYDYEGDSVATNDILMQYGEADGFEDGYRSGQEVLEELRKQAEAHGAEYYELELRRQFLLPALGKLCWRWYGMPDEQTMLSGGWMWESPDRRDPPGARCPGDFLSPSRNAFYPRPSETVKGFADLHGKAILEASKEFVAKHRKLENGAHTGSIAAKMFDKIVDDEVLARNLIGTMIGAVPPMDGNLRGILLEWLDERTLWRHQAALRDALGGATADTNPAAACKVLYGPVSQAMCKRPAPDLLYRTATCAATLTPSGDRKKVEVEDGDLVIVSLVSAAQRSLQKTPYGDVSIIFGGQRVNPNQVDQSGPECPVHACPGQRLAMGAIMGMLAVLLEAGRIQALPASLILRIWP